MPKTPKVQYSNENLQKAIEAVQDVSNNLSTRQIAEKYGVPRSSLRYHIKNPGHKYSCGPSPTLPVAEERRLKEWIIISASKGFPRNKEDILDTVQKFLVKRFAAFGKIIFDIQIRLSYNFIICVDIDTLLFKFPCHCLVFCIVIIV
ncbi:unnamed protein product, partial [Brenthis ino]